MPTRNSPHLLGLMVFFVSVATASAHPGHGAGGGFLQGLSHPVGGLDHLLAMLAVGLWASQIGGRALWLVPLTFVLLMVLGGVFGMLGIPFPFVEGGILVSVVGLGVLIAAAAKLPLPASMALVGMFALFHGHAHGWEMPAETSGLAYACGFVVSTAALHAAGVALGLALGAWSAPVLARAAGLVIAVSGVWLWVGAGAY